MRPLLRHGDCREILSRWPEASVDSVVCDPPYELDFMGNAWDRSGVAFDPETWKTVSRVMKPGAFLIAFGGTRTEHRMTCAIEDGGLLIRDKLMWIYGTGYPKSASISKNLAARGFELDAETWAGWGTALKPAWEPIVLAQKPLAADTIVDQILATGTGALNIDACRIPLLDGESAPTGSGKGSAKSKFSQVANSKGNGGNVTPDQGRWPANLLLDEDAGALLDEQAGVRRSGYVKPRTPRKSTKAKSFGVFRGAATVGGTYGDTGGASRFFYCPKVSAAERERVGNDHPTVKPVALMRWLIRLVTPKGRHVHDPFAGSGSTIVAGLLEGARVSGIDLSGDYLQIIQRRIRAEVPSFRREAASL